IILAAFGPFVALMAIVVGLNGALLLETVNYIEHYGLRREKLPSGKYERVMPRHSWNANYELGRIMLYELTRHSDHHYMASKKFQILDHHEEAPEMPFGYPSAMILAHFPPLWFYVMDRKIQQYEQSMVALG
ncbi:MAG: fatty acid desaturase, partial [Bacteroidota bacterium]